MRIYLSLLISLVLLIVSCRPKCSTCPGMKPNKYQKEAKKMEREMDKKARKEKK